MLSYPQIDLIAIQIGPIKVYWYGITYLIGFGLAWILAKIRANKLNYQWESEVISDFIFYCALGGIIGGRLGYVLLYQPLEILNDPLFVFKIWLGGMSFHGGLIGLICGLFLFAKKMKISFLEMLDFASPLAPLGIALGRIGNFINSELWGRVTTTPWGMIFPNGGPLPRHPSQLYESFAEGVLLFTIIWIYSSKPRPRGTTCGLFLLGYGVFRFICEFFREPDVFIGFIALNWLTMGQLLSLPMIAIGIYMLWHYNKKSPSALDPQL
ncbi:MAG: prolipoprotein diacylglyceryl transferase [Gammaproteobacteria bacterium]|nr:prolipoprotein diacylglyceryl transferase [Gammaproteobacteria bacterium]